ncbi:hypothetical protein EDB81DRAFT_874176 [Dactylonectria macrodidyma]|uniref:Uncharacterized protein n=1 Tax=Dactylonectria macrodidyma TaxID=307937 RepID=A0A9P9FSP8_9HYPO|nr:hypothetical protein EDB81DRAFT_874176 [Dactylonectria macrodidyma]
MSSLSILDDQMSHMSLSDDDDNGYSSDCSHYSLPDLEEDKWLRCIPASEVRKQAKLVPETAAPGAKYPRKLYNKEELPLRVAGPWKEHPLCLNGRYVYGDPGPARVIVNPSVPEGHDVVYHPRRDSLAFLQANYRPRGHRRLRKGLPTAPKSPPTSSLPTPMPSPTLTALPNPGQYGTAFPFAGCPSPPLPQSPGCTPYQPCYNYPTPPNYWASPYLQNPAMGLMLPPLPGFYPVPLNISQYQY